MIFTNIPYSRKSEGKNLGSAYNDFMEYLQEDDWVCFLDHDAMFTTNDWYRQLEELIELYPDAGIITGVTNRIKNLPQKMIVPNMDISKIHDIQFHRRLGKHLIDTKRTATRDITTHGGWLISGILMLIKKSTWTEIGGCMDGFLQVDNDIHKRVRDIGKRVYVCDGLYLYHWYREKL